ncbi:hypothetical protein C8J56DRAFT_891151 [Mycena floridula]|nr:hypothetical protein C8J56DRAFT_891151 [Mycena floridula]
MNTYTPLLSQSNPNSDSAPIFEPNPMPREASLAKKGGRESVQMRDVRNRVFGSDLEYSITYPTSLLSTTVHMPPNLQTMQLPAQAHVAQSMNGLTRNTVYCAQRGCGVDGWHEMGGVRVDIQPPSGLSWTHWIEAWRQECSEMVFHRREGFFLEGWLFGRTGAFGQGRLQDKRVDSCVRKGCFGCVEGMLVKKANTGRNGPSEASRSLTLFELSAFQSLIILESLGTNEYCDVGVTGWRRRRHTERDKSLSGSRRPKGTDIRVDFGGTKELQEREPQTIGNRLGPAKRPSRKHVELNEGGPQGQEKREAVEVRVGVVTVVARDIQRRSMERVELKLFVAVFPLCLESLRNGASRAQDFASNTMMPKHDFPSPDAPLVLREAKV